MSEHVAFIFSSSAYPEDTFQVVSFLGEEGLSRCYEFNINLATTAPYIDLAELLNHPATFTILQGPDEAPYHGIVLHADQVNRVGEFTFYSVVLTPRLSWLNMTFHNQVFLAKTIPTVLEEVLKDGGLTALDYEFRLQGGQDLYPEWEMICQYNQSHFDFFSFWAESMGLYYYFEQGRQNEKLVVTDSHLAHTPLKDDGRMSYTTPSGLDYAHAHELLYFLRRRQQRVPRSVTMKDYDYAKPSLDLTVEAGVMPHGVGQVNIYGDLAHFKTREHGALLARIRAEELRCQEKLHLCKAHTPRIRPGYVFQLQGHYQDDFNQKYLTTYVKHYGSQASYLRGDLRRLVSDEKGKPINILTRALQKISLSKAEKLNYQNEFNAIPARIQYRPERKTPASRIWGNLSAFIDASGSGQYAEIDEMGRYKVIMPFDSSGRKGLKASAWLRLAQPFGGSNQGMHFPLRKGTEVLLSFLDGDPNRPIITGTAPNAETPNVVTSKNSTQAGFSSSGGNQIHMEDTEGSERIVMQSGDGSSTFKMGLSSDLAELLTGSGSVSSVSSSMSTEVIGVSKSLSSAASNSTLVGSIWFTAIQSLASSVIGKVPKLVEKILDDVIDFSAYGTEQEKAQKEEQEKEEEKEESSSQSEESGEESTESETEDDSYEVSAKTVKNVIGTVSNLVSPVVELLLQQYIKKAAKEIVQQYPQLKFNPKSALDFDKKYNRKFAYSVISAHKKTAGVTTDTAVMVELQSMYKVDGFNVTKLLEKPKGMLFFEGEGDQVFYTQQCFDVTAKENIECTSLKNTRHHADGVLILSSTDKLKSVAREGLEIRCGKIEDRLVKFPSSSLVLEADPEALPELKLIADKGHIIIKQDTSNKDGYIELESSKSITAQVKDKGSLEINDASANLSFQKSKLKMEESQATVEVSGLTGTSQVLMDHDGVALSANTNNGTSGQVVLGNDSAYVSAGGCHVKVSATGVQINGTLVELG